MLLDVLHLFAKLVDDRFKRQTKARDIDGVRLRAQRIGFAIEFLSKKIELAADGPRFAQNFARGSNVGRQPRQLLFNIGARRNQDRFLMQAVFVQSLIGIHQA